MKTPPIGTITQTMEMGHVVTCKVLADKGNEFGYIKCEFLCHHKTGKETLLLDFGQDWWIEKGDSFHCHPEGFARASKYIEKRVGK